MPITKTEINLNLFDTDALVDAEYSSTDIQPFVDLADMKVDFIEPSNYATLENNQFLLDGEKDLFPDDMSTIEFGYWSLSQSDVLAALDVPFSINFDDIHSTIGLTFDFYQDDFATDINIKWYDALDDLIVEKDFTNNKALFFASEAVLDYKRVEVTFNENNSAGHYIKLNKISFGADILFSDSEIKACNIVEEISTISDEISINKMTASVLLEDIDFIQDIYSVLQDQQKLIVTEYVDDVPKDMGTFYLNTRSNPNENTIIFNTEDIIGTMANVQYLGGIVNDTFENVVNAIMGSYGTTLFTIADELKSLIVAGHIPITYHRRALQLVCFAVNAVVDCSRSDKANIYRLPTVSPQSVDKSRYFIGSTQTELPKITGITLNQKSYEVGTGLEEIYKVTHISGNYIATFDKPFSGFIISNGVIISSNANYVEFGTPGGEVIISGIPYNESNQIFSVSTPNLPVNVVQNVVEFENTIVWDGEQNSQYLYDMLIDLNERSIRIVLEDESAGSFLSVDALYDKLIEGYVELLNINLSGGFIGQAKIVGVIK